MTEQYLRGRKVSVWPTARNFPHLMTILEMVEKLEKDYGITVDLEFTNGRGANHTKKNSGRHVIRFGKAGIEYDIRRGYHEYDIVMPYVRKYLGRTGVAAVRLVVIHEFAHAVDTELNGRQPNVAHPRSFVETLVQLIAENDHLLAEE